MEILYIAVGIYMLIGIVLFEWAYAKMKPFRNIDEARDS